MNHKNKAPVFSVIMPVYNKEKYVARAVKSVLSQSFEDFELIIIDDGSGDGSISEIRKIKDKRIRIYGLKRNRGASYARNAGIKKAKGDYIAFLDADDEYLNGFLEEINRLIKKYKGFGFFAASFLFVDKKGVKTHKRFGLKKDLAIENVMLKMINYKFFFHISSIAVAKKVFDDIGLFQSSYKGGAVNSVISEDSDLYLRISEKYKLAYSNKPGCVYYRNIAGSVTNSTDKKINIDYSFYEKTLIDFINASKNKAEKTALGRLLNQLYEKVSIRFLERGEYGKAYEVLSKSVAKSKRFYKIKALIKKSEILKRLS